MIVTLEEAKGVLYVLHNADDERIVRAIEGAEDECLQFMDRSHLPLRGEECPSDCSSESDVSSVDESSGSDLVPSVRSAIYLLIKADYYFDRMSPREVEICRQRAEQLCMPYRCRLGT